MMKFCQKSTLFQKIEELQSMVHERHKHHDAARDYKNAEKIDTKENRKAEETAKREETNWQSSGKQKSGRKKINHD